MFTPEDAFVASANTCVMMMFLWAAERFKLDLVSYTCRTEGTKRIELDRTELFTHLRFWPEITVRANVDEDTAATEKRVLPRPGIRPEVQPGGEFGQERDCYRAEDHRDQSTA